MTFPVAFPTTRRTEIAAPAEPARWMLRGAELAAAIAVNLGADPMVAPIHADRGVVVTGPRVPAAPVTSWIASW
ncbi:hypothetical protein [Actinoplanes sp. CA-252034]|uniref:hypothetical protein n=1 Tax=Actinoplanes sp. CA-252034 TaxID=3239906 RepID=UPI003D979864